MVLFLREIFKNLPAQMLINAIYPTKSSDKSYTRKCWHHVIWSIVIHIIFMTVWHVRKTIWWMNAVGRKNKGTRLFTREHRPHCTFVLKTRPFPKLSKTRKTLGETSWFSQPHLPAPPPRYVIYFAPQTLPSTVPARAANTLLPWKQRQLPECCQLK